MKYHFKRLNILYLEENLFKLAYIYLNCDVENGRIVVGIMFALVDLFLYAILIARYVKSSKETLVYKAFATAKSHYN